MSGKSLGRRMCFDDRAGYLTRDGKIVADAELKGHVGSHPKGSKISEDGDHRVMVWKGDDLVATYEPGDYATGEDENGVHIVRKGDPQNQFVKHSPEPIGDAAPPCRVSSGQTQEAYSDLKRMNARAAKLAASGFWGGSHG